MIFPAILLSAPALSYVLRNRRWHHERVELLAFAVHRITMALGPASSLRAFFTFLGMRAGGMRSCSASIGRSRSSGRSPRP
jgi:hypothetical protein